MALDSHPIVPRTYGEVIDALPLDFAIRFHQEFLFQVPQRQLINPITKLHR